MKSLAKLFKTKQKMGQEGQMPEIGHILHIKRKKKCDERNSEKDLGTHRNCVPSPLPLSLSFN